MKRKRITRRIIKRATAHNLSIEEKIVKNLCELHNITSREAWQLFKQKQMFRELPV